MKKWSDRCRHTEVKFAGLLTLAETLIIVVDIIKRLRTMHLTPRSSWLLVRREDWTWSTTSIAMKSIYDRKETAEFQRLLRQSKIAYGNHTRLKCREREQKESYIWKDVTWRKYRWDKKLSAYHDWNAVNLVVEDPPLGLRVTQNHIPIRSWLISLEKKAIEENEKNVLLCGGIWYRLTGLLGCLEIRSRKERTCPWKKECFQSETTQQK